jgi:hypothetical protein
MMDMVQRQYDSVLQSVYNLVHADWFMPATEVDEMEICCELVELYDKIYAPLETDF